MINLRLTFPYTPIGTELRIEASCTYDLEDTLDAALTELRKQTLLGRLVNFFRNLRFK